MRALLLKDYYTSRKDGLIYVIIVIMIALMPPNITAMGMGMFFAVMISFVSVAYDERCKWDTLANTMPYTTLELVLSKYCMSYLCILGSLVLFGVSSLYWFFSHHWEHDFISIILSSISFVLVLLAVMLPILFRWGVERSRIFMGLVMGIIVAVTVWVMDMGVITITTRMQSIVPILISVISQFISIWLSVSICEGRKKHSIPRG